MTTLAHGYRANPHWLPPGRRDALRAIPGNFGLPIIGNTLKMLRDPIAFGEGMIARYGPVYRSHSFGGPTVTLIGADANELVLFDRNRIFSSEQGWGPVLNLLFPRGLMLLDFAEHRADRKTLSVAFKPEPMRHYAEALSQGVAAQLPGWAGQPLRFYDRIKALTLDLAATSFLGMPLGPAATRISRAFVDEVQASVAPIRSPLPGTMMRRGVNARAYLVDLFTREIPARRAGDGQDFFSQFCRATDDAGAPLADSAIADHMNFLMMAAHDTVTSSITSLIMQLGRNPEWQERLHAEIVAISPDGVIAAADLDRLVLVDMAFKEALRMAPPVPSIPRRALKPFDFGGFRIPAGSTIGISVRHVHYSGEHWDIPAAFDPLRFTADRVRTRHRYAWVPFGGGAHMCLGLHFATMQTRIFVAQLLARYRILLDPGSGAAWQAWPIPRPRDGLPLRLAPR